MCGPMPSNGWACRPCAWTHYTEGPPVYRLEIPVTGRRRPIEIAVFKTEAEAAIQADLLRIILKS